MTWFSHISRPSHLITGTNVRGQSSKEEEDALSSCNLRWQIVGLALEFRFSLCNLIEILLLQQVLIVDTANSQMQLPTNALYAFIITQNITFIDYWLK